MPAARLYSWTKKGRANQHRVKTRWGKQGRVNLIGTLLLEGRFESLEYRMLEGPCQTAEVMDYLDALAEKAEREVKPVVVVLDRAPFHRAGAVRERRPGWEGKGLRLYSTCRRTAALT